MDNSEVNFSGAVQPTSPLENAANSLPKEERKTISSKKRSKLPLIIILIIILLAAAAFAVYFFFINPETKLGATYPGFEEIYNNSNSFEEAISKSQSYIDAEQSNEKKAAMYTERANFLFDKFAISEDNALQILSDAEAADAILQTTDSAYFVYNFYNFFRYPEKAQIYYNLFETRFSETPIQSTGGKG